MTNRDHVEEQAIGWLVRLRDPLFDDWDGFTAWLEQDPRHTDAYERAALADEAAVEALTAPQPRPILPAPERRAPNRRLALGAMLGASLVAFFGLQTLRSASHVIETAPGEHRSITLASGDRIDMNGGTRLILDGDNPRFAELDAGEALFTVRHDEANPFIVEAGGTVLRDVGTVFNVTQGENGLHLAVSEGAVEYDPEGQRLLVSAGRALRATPGAQPRLLEVAASDVAGWRQGRLVYAGAPLRDVAADLSRNLGVPIAVEGDGARPFVGVIQLDRSDPAFYRRLGPLLGVDVRQAGDGWTLVAR